MQHRCLDKELTWTHSSAETAGFACCFITSLAHSGSVCVEGAGAFDLGLKSGLPLDPAGKDRAAAS